MAGPYSIGSDEWNGLSKLIEEGGEVSDLLPELILMKTLGRLQQVEGKLIGSGGNVAHYDGSNLRDRLEQEIGDLQAAIDFFIEKNSLRPSVIDQRFLSKRALFRKWDRERT